MDKHERRRHEAYTKVERRARMACYDAEQMEDHVRNATNELHSAISGGVITPEEGVELMAGLARKYDSINGQCQEMLMPFREDYG